MNFLEKMLQRVTDKYKNPRTKDFRREYPFIGSELIDLALKDMQELDLIYIEKSNGRLKVKKPFNILI